MPSPKSDRITEAITGYPMTSVRMTMAGMTSQKASLPSRSRFSARGVRRRSRVGCSIRTVMARLPAGAGAGLLLDRLLQIGGHLRDRLIDRHLALEGCIAVLLDGEAHGVVVRRLRPGYRGELRLLQGRQVRRDLD